MLLEVLHRLVERGNTVLVIEHNVDVIKTADWIIDLGPEGGEIVAQGPPEEVARSPRSFTGHFLAPLLHVTPRAGARAHAHLPASRPQGAHGHVAPGIYKRAGVAERSRDEDPFLLLCLSAPLRDRLLRD